MKLTDMQPDDRKRWEQDIYDLANKYGIETYKDMSKVLREAAQSWAREHGRAEVDKRQARFTLTRTVIWDIRDGTDHGIECAENLEPEVVVSLKGVIKSMSETLAGYFEYMRWETPESCTLDALLEREPSFKTQLGRNKGDSHFRVYFDDPEGNKHLAITEVKRGEVT